MGKEYYITKYKVAIEWRGIPEEFRWFSGGSENFEETVDDFIDDEKQAVGLAVLQYAYGNNYFYACKPEILTYDPTYFDYTLPPTANKKAWYIGEVKIRKIVSHVVKEETEIDFEKPNLDAQKSNS